MIDQREPKSKQSQIVQRTEKNQNPKKKQKTRLKARQSEELMICNGARTRLSPRDLT